jgi:hypothetical protein
LLRHRLDRLLQRLQPLRLLGDTRLQLQSAPRCPWLPGHCPSVQLQAQSVAR